MTGRRSVLAGLLSTAALICLLTVCSAQGLENVGGYARLTGPLRSCQVVLSNLVDGRAVAVVSTDASGKFFASFPNGASSIYRADLQPSESCQDGFTGLPLALPLTTGVPRGTTTAAVGTMALSALAYLELGNSSSVAALLEASPAGLRRLAQSTTEGSPQPSPAPLSPSISDSGGITDPAPTVPPAPATPLGNASYRSPLPPSPSIPPSSPRPPPSPSSPLPPPPASYGNSQLADNATLFRASVSALYTALGLQPSQLAFDPLTVQPLALLSSASRDTRSLAVALLAAEAQVGAVVALGGALLAAAKSRASGGAPLGAGDAARYTRLVAAAGVEQLLALTAAGSTGGGSSPSPSPGPPASSGSSAPAVMQGVAAQQDGLNSTDFLRGVLLAAAQAGGVAVPDAAVNATALVASGFADFADGLKRVALAELRGVAMGLNPLNALITMARLAAVQADAAGRMGGLVDSDPAALATYVLDALPERISKAAVDVAAVHAALGLEPPAGSTPAAGVAHVVGPLRGCSGQASDLWAPAYTSFTTGSSGDSAGQFTLSAKGLGAVAVSPYRACTDALTGLALNLSVSNLGPAGGRISVSPVAMLAQGLYTLQATQSLLTVSRAQQEAAFSAMGLSLAAYEQALLPGDGASLLAAGGSGSGSPGGSGPNSTAGSGPSGASSVPPPRNAVQANAFNLSHPLTPAVVAANAQLTGLFYAARALFAPSCYYAYGMDSHENAHILTVTLVTYAAAQQVLTAPNSRLDLSSQSVLTAIFGVLRAACAFNSTGLDTSGAANATVPQPLPNQATLLAGGAGSVAGVTQLGGRRRAQEGLHGDGEEQGPVQGQRPVQGQAEGTASALLLDALGAHGHHRRWEQLQQRLAHALFSHGVVSLPALLPAAFAPEDIAGVGSSGLVGGPAAAAADGCDDARGGDGGDGGRRTAFRARRELYVYSGNGEMVNLYSLVAEVLAEVNTQLRSLQAEAQAAAAAAAAAAAPSPLALYNVTELLLNATRLGWVAQSSLYNRIVTVMSTSLFGLPLVMAMQRVAADHKGAALQARMAEATINTALICSSAGATCASPSGTGQPPPGRAPSAGAAPPKSNTGLYVGIALGAGLGAAALLALGVFAYRRARKRQIKQTVVNTFKAGDMAQMNLRVASTLRTHLDGSPLMGPAYPGGKSAILDGGFHPLVPAALGTNPSLQTDYPLYPTHSATGPHPQLYQQGQGHARAYAAAEGPVGNGVPPLPYTTGVAVAGAAPAYTPQHGGLPQAAGAGTGWPQGYKTYPNSAFVPADGAASPQLNSGDRHNATGRRSQGAASDTRSGSPASPYRQVLAAPLASAASAPPSPRPAGSLIAASGSAGGAGLNGTLGRRQLPPLAPYTSVTNPAAPASALNASIRAIPVNANFNSSLRPPQQQQQQQQAQGGGSPADGHSPASLRTHSALAGAYGPHGPSNLGGAR